MSRIQHRYNKETTRVCLWKGNPFIAERQVAWKGQTGKGMSQLLVSSYTITGEDFSQNTRDSFNLVAEHLGVLHQHMDVWGTHMKRVTSIMKLVNLVLLQTNANDLEETTGWMHHPCPDQKAPYLCEVEQLA